MNLWQYWSTLLGVLAMTCGVGRAGEERTIMKTIFLPLSLLIGTVSVAIADPLPSWNNTGSKEAIVSFVERVTKEDSKDFVPADQRIAVFDNDGTLPCLWNRYSNQHKR